MRNGEDKVTGGGSLRGGGDQGGDPEVVGTGGVLGASHSPQASPWDTPVEG